MSNSRAFRSTGFPLSSADRSASSGEAGDECLFGQQNHGSSKMKTFSKLTVAALMSAGAMALISTNASASIVCNQDGDCWHAQQQYAYQPAFGLTVHDNGWKWKDGEKHAWREHEGKGYWKGGNWQGF
jgi:hypothetical protein